MSKIIHRINNDNNNNNNNNIKDSLTKYKEIIKKYQNGEYGCEHLSLYEILLRAGEPNLLSQMSLEELDELINNSFGVNKALFISIKNELITQEKIKDDIKCEKV